MNRVEESTRPLDRAHDSLKVLVIEQYLSEQGIHQAEDRAAEVMPICPL